MKGKQIFALLEEAYDEWGRDNASMLAAALAYYAVFSLAPMLVIAIAIAGMAFGEKAARGEVMGQIQSLVGPSGAHAIQTMLQSASKPASSIAASLIGLVTLLFGATGAFACLQDGLNTVWGVMKKPGQSWFKSFFQGRFHAFALLLAIGFLLLISLIVSASLSGMGKYFGDVIQTAATLEAINFAISFLVITLLFAMIYKILPDVHIGWSDVWVGAAITSLLFTIGKFLIGLYLGHSSITSAYGAAGSLVIVLVWVYYSAQILFLGAEITRAYANRYGSRIVPKGNAVPVTAEARTRQGLPARTRKAGG